MRRTYGHRLLHAPEAHRSGQATSFGSPSGACSGFPAMTELAVVAWPVAPITTERLVLRESEARDRAAFIELLASPDVHTYLGGPQARDELERSVPETPGRRPGHFVIELDGAMIGTVEVSRREGGRRGHGRPGA